MSLIRCAVLTIGIAAAGVPNCRAVQLHSERLDNGDVIIDVIGPIVEGDSVRLLQFAGSFPNKTTFAAISIDSPGGDILEGEKLATLVARTKMPVIVGPNAECSSACFLVFAAGSKRIAASTALVGVHSASTSGHEDWDSLAATTAMARDASGYGVPPAIIGKMVETPPGRVAWLSPDELVSMGAVILKTPDATSPPAISSAPPMPPTQEPSYAYAGSTTGSIPPTAPPLAFSQGAADRRAWEAWFDGLTGDYRSGAEYWASHRSLPHPGSCYSATGQQSADFVSGCLAARRQLTPSDGRRKSEPDYRAGWNSL